jgi:uncharacterized membrane protein HdeD (DUF308 family)
MAIVMADKWRTFVVRGAAGILFGLLTFFWPKISLAVLVLLFGAYALVDGAFNLVEAFSNKRGERRSWGLVFQGLAGLGAGIITLMVPGLAALALLYVIAAWAIVTGAFEIVGAVRLRKHIRGEWLLALSGVLAIVFGIFVASFPGTGALALVLWIGAYAFVFGCLLVALGLKLRRWARTEDAATARRAA